MFSSDIYQHHLSHILNLLGLTFYTYFFVLLLQVCVVIHFNVDKLNSKEKIVKVAGSYFSAKGKG